MLIGAFSLSISGSLTAMERRFDYFGAIIIAFVTAAGGGTLRDVLIGREVFWMANPIYVYIIISGTILSIILRKKLQYLRQTLLLFDTNRTRLIYRTGN